MLILFIDDDEEDYALFCEALQSFDRKAECVHASDGKDGLNLLTNILIILPDFIFLDVNMPVMGGKECLMQIKSDPRLKDIPVILYTTTSHFGEIENFKKLGVKDFIVKPATFNGLVHPLREVLLDH